MKQKDGTTFTVPGFKVAEVVDTVGAGDGFAVGLITGLIEGKSLNKRLFVLMPLERWPFNPLEITMDIQLRRN